jgi:DnaJ-class molecular chaperone
MAACSRCGGSGSIQVHVMPGVKEIITCPSCNGEGKK